jgi:hypothetical protein
LPLGVYIKGIARAFNWLKCLGGIMIIPPKHLSQLKSRAIPLT